MCNIILSSVIPWYNNLKSQQNITGNYLLFSCLRSLNTLRPRQNGRHFPDDIIKCIFLNENAWTSLQISLKFVPKVRIDNIPALVQIMAWRRPGDKPLSEPMVVSFLTHICVARPQWVNHGVCFNIYRFALYLSIIFPDVTLIRW